MKHPSASGMTSFARQTQSATPSRRDNVPLKRGDDSVQRSIPTKPHECYAQPSNRLLVWTNRPTKYPCKDYDQCSKGIYCRKVVRFPAVLAGDMVAIGFGEAENSEPATCCTGCNRVGQWGSLFHCLDTFIGPWLHRRHPDIDSGLYLSHNVYLPRDLGLTNTYPKYISWTRSGDTLERKL